MNNQEGKNAWVQRDPDKYIKLAKYAGFELASRHVFEEEYGDVSDEGQLSIPLSNWMGEFIRNHPTNGYEEAYETMKGVFAEMPYAMGKIGQLTYTQTFAVPGGSVTLGGTITCDISNHNYRSIGYAGLRRFTLDAYNDFLRDTKARAATADSLHQSKGLSPLATNSGNSPGAGETVEIQFVKLTKGFRDDGKPTYKLWGKPYMQFGVNLYEEVIDQNGHTENFTNLKPGSYDLTGTCTVYLKNGKPVRVNKYQFDPVKSE